MIGAIRSFIYIKHRTVIANSHDVEVPTYSEPIKVICTPQTNSSRIDILKYGEKADEMVTIKLDKRYCNTIGFRKGDKAYIIDGLDITEDNIDSLVVDDANCTRANFEIASTPAISARFTSITFKRRERV